MSGMTEEIDYIRHLLIFHINTRQLLHENNMSIVCVNLSIFLTQTACNRLSLGQKAIMLTLPKITFIVIYVINYYLIFWKI